MGGDGRDARCRDHFEEAADTHRAAAGQLSAVVAAAAAVVEQALKRGGTVLVCGNGGSAAESQHFAAELTGRFRRERRGWPAVALTTDVSALTSIGNDYGFAQVFARQVEALGRPGDVLLALSTSGTSANIVEAARRARASGMSVVALTGPDAGAVGALADVVVAAPGTTTARVQEVHLTVLHAMCDEIEAALVDEGVAAGDLKPEA
jgi:D-sedoheptulose 7-phosphate isomerase